MAKLDGAVGAELALGAGKLLLLVFTLIQTIAGHCPGIVTFRAGLMDPRSFCHLLKSGNGNEKQLGPQFARIANLGVGNTITRSCFFFYIY